MFGARVQDLPDIWEELVNAGFESGHAYAKALRTVKSCVGTTWCRYGVQDSVGFAIRVEHRYKGIRAPHKIKMAVSGCIRECAEAQGKDVGLIATEKGYNLYVCGNGGSKPRHADLLASDLDEETALKYIDRFLAYYIMTADRLTRTSVWLEKLEGGIDHIRDVVVHDKLGIAAELEAMTQRLVDTYECEWAAVVRDPEKRRRFRQFVSSDESEPCIEFVSERGQSRPADWPSEFVSLDQFRMLDGRSLGEVERRSEPTLRWVPVGYADDFPIDGGATVKYGKSQIAVFNFASRGQWYATQNMCPHKKAFVLSRGIIGTAGDEPKVACPLHKKTFSLETGESLQGEEYRIKTFRVKVENGKVYVELPPPEMLDPVMATEIGCKLATLLQRPCERSGGMRHRQRLRCRHDSLPIVADKFNRRPSVRAGTGGRVARRAAVAFRGRTIQPMAHERRWTESRLTQRRQRRPTLHRTTVARYHSLLPATPPGPGQQYAFEVDLDRCSGCKACVVACHTLNGLDENETWRDVGLLVGGSRTAPVMQHVTAACHHCLQPACMIACPVNAYEKDPITGIVKHLDDQCFGCQYCTMACPYEVPKYHPGKGIVRKCDMCSSRLAVGEPPACVQSCPHRGDHDSPRRSRTSRRRCRGLRLSCQPLRTRKSRCRRRPTKRGARFRAICCRPITSA